MAILYNVYISTGRLF